MATYAVVTTTEATDDGAKVKVAKIELAKGRGETKTRQIFDDLNEAKAHAIRLNAAFRDVYRDVILDIRKLRMHNLVNEEPPGTNRDGKSWQEMLGTQGPREATA